MSDAKAASEARRQKILARGSSRLSVAKGEKPTAIDGEESTSVEEVKTEMSDAKAASEARRQKILARGSSRLSVAKGEKPTAIDGEESTSVEEVKTEISSPISTTDSPSISPRPLAQRRKLVKSKSSTSVESPLKNDSDENAAITTDIIDAGKKSEKCESPAIDDEKTVTTSLTPKIVKKIEAEIARNTADHDKKVVSNGSKISEESGKKVKLLKPVAPIAPLTSAQMLRFIRMLGIIALGIYLGYTAALAGIVDTKKAGLIYKIQVGNGNNDLLSSFIGSQSHAAAGDALIVGATAGASNDKSYTKWLSCAVTGVGVIRILVGMLQGPLDRMFPSKTQSSGGLFQMVEWFYNKGIEAVLEIGYSFLGELALHVFTMIATVVAISAMAEYSGAGLGHVAGVTSEL